MLGYVLPIAVIVLSEVIYQMCAKSSPDGIDPFAVLVVTYGVGMVASLLLFYAVNRSENISLFSEFGKINRSPLLLGLAIIGLEVGHIYAFRAGWQISTLSIVESSILAVILTFIGVFFYHEVLTWSRILGIAICTIGLIFINLESR
ncbi:MAG: EamA family transporter [Synergistes sp.]|nr:EamA family transporter [Synergistes sp.]